MTAGPGLPPPATSYGALHAGVYDRIHAARGRDWDTEADEIAALVLARNPAASSLLDAACGTGKHLVRFARHFPEVAGLDASEPMLRIARTRLPAEVLHRGDIRDIRLDRRFDAVLCLCFSLGYMTSVGDLRIAIAELAGRLRPGGVLVAEPWWFPEDFADRFASGGLAVDDEGVVSRVSHSVRDGDVCRMSVHYTVAGPDGIRSFVEEEVYSLFTYDEYVAAFTACGLGTEFLDGGPNGRGLFVAVADPRPTHRRTGYAAAVAAASTG